ncbi:MAG: caspase family protein, partial [Bacteroidota bacterium]
MRALFLLVTLLSFQNATAQKKYALIVAVGTYMPGSNIASIASLNDIKYIKAVLKNNGFIPANIATLENAKATKAGILLSLDGVAKKAAAGDVVLLHFSMHGQQIRDQREGLGKDEDDGYDEAL